MNAWAIAYQAPLSMEFCMQEYWSGLPFPYSNKAGCRVLSTIMKRLCEPMRKITNLYMTMLSRKNASFIYNFKYLYILFSIHTLFYS